MRIEIDIEIKKVGKAFWGLSIKDVHQVKAEPLKTYSNTPYRSELLVFENGNLKIHKRSGFATSLFIKLGVWQIEVAIQSSHFWGAS